MCVSMSGALSAARSASPARGPGASAADVVPAQAAEQATPARNARRSIRPPPGGQAALPPPVDALPPEADLRDLIALLPLFPPGEHTAARSRRSPARRSYRRGRGTTRGCALRPVVALVLRSPRTVLGERPA